MLESTTLIDFTLSFAGENLTFGNFTIKGIPEELADSVPAFSSPFDVVQQIFSFRISGIDLNKYSIARGDTFTYTSGKQIFTFTVIGYVVDLTGWAKLDVVLDEVANV